MTNTIALPQPIFKRLEKIATSSKRSPASIVKQAVQDRLDYEEWFIKQVADGLADEKAGRVYGKEEFWAQLDKARGEHKQK